MTKAEHYRRWVLAHFLFGGWQTAREAVARSKKGQQVLAQLVARGDLMADPMEHVTLYRITEQGLALLPNRP